MSEISNEFMEELGALVFHQSYRRVNRLTTLARLVVDGAITLEYFRREMLKHEEWEKSVENLSDMVGYKFPIY